jgi:hypothetical protein
MSEVSFRLSLTPEAITLILRLLLSHENWLEVDDDQPDVAADDVKEYRLTKQLVEQFSKLDRNSQPPGGIA